MTNSDNSLSDERYNTCPSLCGRLHFSLCGISIVYMHVHVSFATTYNSSRLTNKSLFLTQRISIVCSFLFICPCFQRFSHDISHFSSCFIFSSDNKLVFTNNEQPNSLKSIEFKLISSSGD